MPEIRPFRNKIWTEEREGRSASSKEAEAQILGALKQVEARRTVEDVARKYCRMEVGAEEAKHLRERAGR